MKPKIFAAIALIAGTTGCGGTWVDTDAGDCQESQIEEMRQEAETFARMGAELCQSKGKGDFAGEFRCTGSEADGTRKLQVKCEG